MKKEVLFKLENISKKFGKNEILKKINLEIYKGRIFAVVGPSGSGKTTLLRILTKFYNPTEGQIYLNGKKLKNLSDDIKYLIGFSAQHGSFYPNLTVEENIEFFAKLYGLKKFIINERMEELLKRLEIYEYKKMKVANLSKGIQKRIDLACALIHNPEIIILDEPMEDLDPYLRKKVCGIIKELNKMKKTIIICSHFFTELEEICDDIAILFDGKIIEKGPIEVLKKKYNQKSLVEIFLQLKKKKKIKK